MSHDDFLAAIVETPDDDAPRLVYADWLEDHGDDKSRIRAEFIRLQCRLASLSPGSAEATRLARREKELLKAHGSEWSDTHLGMVGELRRGFIEHVTTWPHAFIESGAQLVEKFPVRSLRLRVDSEDVDAIRRLAQAPHLGRITHLSFERAQAAMMGLGNSGLRALLASPHLTGLRVLDLGRCALHDACASAFARAEQLRCLEELELGNNQFGTVLAEAIANAEHLSGLRYLGLAGNRLAPPGVEALIASPHLQNLKSLDLSHTRILTRGVQELTEANFLARLEVLRLGRLGLGVSAAKMLAGCSHLSGLVELDLARNKLADSGVAALAGSSHLAGLKRLGLRRNGLTVAGVTALGESKYLQNLERLDLGGNLITPAEREQLREVFGKRFGRF
jgi:uncharacterized protein (TIGR02996 family)